MADSQKTTIIYRVSDSIKLQVTHSIIERTAAAPYPTKGSMSPGGAANRIFPRLPLLSHRVDCPEAAAEPFTCTQLGQVCICHTTSNLSQELPSCRMPSAFTSVLMSRME
jgi:hypothetical protein